MQGSWENWETNVWNYLSFQGKARSGSSPKFFSTEGQILLWQNHGNALTLPQAFRFRTTLNWQQIKSNVKAIQKVRSSTSKAFCSRFLLRDKSFALPTVLCLSSRYWLMSYFFFFESFKKCNKTEPLPVYILEVSN